MIGEKVLHQKPVSLNEVKQLLSDRKKEKDLSYEQDLTLKYAKRFTKLSPANAEKLLEEVRKIVGISDAQASKIVDLLPEKKETLEMVFPKDSKIGEATIEKILGLCNKYRK
ncbi:MAG: DNA-directed RNA polymerase subunit F [Candidatus Diapherotrites archaeon]|uniref:DNA-directed RNA polymerase subunit Rpo4 n=1 Tax=Candidatus Iainarchaeum sp. TaxID=3101447 RepID=A0A938YYP9_9ARCH|nr:DNA-directed RNA polymerase subunit F [Candidatus Diapherotrites archaeon]